MSGATICAAIYLGLSVVLFVFSMFQCSLLVAYLRRQKTASLEPLQALPFVTIQLPIYNERYVVERLLKTVLAIDYPKDKFEIQILDDSTDDTSDIIANFIVQNTDFQIHNIKRSTRTGYKAGALAHGLTTAKGEYVAIFDADFTPKSDFLRVTLSHFTDQSVGLVQSRWEHLNQNQSWFVRLQTVGLDGHFRVEQAGRNAAKFLINFNGTAGVWRKSCIEDAGGWSADTLAEDFDLSYRAQFKGWRLVYLEQYATPAEVPATLSAFRSQQYRWMKGGAECAKKNLMAASKLSGVRKWQAAYHLLNSSTFLWGFLLALTSVFCSGLWPSHGADMQLLAYGQFFQVGWLVLIVFYWVAARNRYSFGQFLALFPAFLALISGLSWYNAVAVAEGYAGIKTPFVRTPKWGSSTQNQYHSTRFSLHTIVEMGLLVFFTFGIYLDVRAALWGMIPYHALLAVGYGLVVFLSVSESFVSKIKK